MGVSRSVGEGLILLLLMAMAAIAAPAGERAAAPAGAAAPPKPPPKTDAPSAQKPQTPPDTVAQIDWRTSVEAAMKEAAESPRIILVSFYADFCEPCKTMERGMFGSRPIALYISRHFIPVKIDDSKAASATSQTYNVRAYPTIIFLSPSGDVLHRVTAPLTPREFQPLMERVESLPGLLEAQKQKPDDLEANFALGNSLAILNQMARAAPYLERAAQLDPGNKKGRLSQARLILAMVPLLEEGDSAKTLALLDKFEADFKGDPEIPVAVFYRGTVLFHDGKLEEARKVFERMQKEFPKHWKTYDADKAILEIDARLKALKRLAEQGAAKPAASGKDAVPPAEKQPAEPARKPEPKPKG